MTRLEQALWLEIVAGLLLIAGCVVTLLGHDSIAVNILLLAGMTFTASLSRYRSLR